MDTYEATKIVMSRIQSLDPENASRIMGYILIQDQGDKEMIRLAFGPESLLISLINQAKSCLGIQPNTFSTASSPRLVIPPSPTNPSSSPSSPWSFHASRSPTANRPPPPPPPPSYAAVVNGSNNTLSSTSSNNDASASAPTGTSSTSSLPIMPFYSNNSNITNDEYPFPFFDEPMMSPSGRSDSFLFPPTTPQHDEINNPASPFHHHRRSCSVNDVFLSGEDVGSIGGVAGGGWRPCMYYARGFCKNGSSCKFLHGMSEAHSPVESSNMMMVGSPKLDHGGGGGGGSFDELLRMKAIQQQRQLLASSGIHHPPNHPNPLGYNKCINFLTDNQRSAAAALMMGEEIQRFGRCRPDRSDFAAMGLGLGANSSSRQIYLTFPADSTFKEEDVSNYFSMYGPVQDVRIPYQQKRMFGFVTFVYPETVKMILAKGNPHFVCDSRVLVKPYKEKGKVPEKRLQQQQQQHMDRGDFGACLSPSGLDSREACDLPFGARMFYNSQEMMLRRKLEQEAELQQVMELQGRRLMNMQLLELKNQHQNLLMQPSLSPGVAIHLPDQARPQTCQNVILPAEALGQEIREGSNGVQEMSNSPNLVADEKVSQEVDEASNNRGGVRNKEGGSELEVPNHHESLELILPDNLFASPTKVAAERMSIFSAVSSEADASVPITSSNSIPMLPPASTVGMASIKSSYVQMPSH